jgi:ribonuclease P protein component
MCFHAAAKKEEKSFLYKPFVSFLPLFLSSSFFMLPKRDRLTKKDIQLFFSSKNRLVRGATMMMRFQGNKQSKNRWAVVVSSSVKKNAYHRNTTRRRIFAIIRSIQDRIPTGFDFIISTRLTKKSSLSSRLLKDDMIQILHTCKLFH